MDKAGVIPKVSQRLDEYFSASLDALPMEKVLPCPIFQYSSRLRRMIVWKSKGCVLGGEFLALFRDRGVYRFWVRKSDLEAFQMYFQAERHLEELELSGEQKQVRPYTESGDKIASLLLADGVDPRYKKGGAASEARKIVEQLTCPNSVEEQKPVTAKAREVVQDVLQGLNCEVATLASEIWKIAELEPELGHGVNVATYTVLFALAFGRIDPALLSDLALAGLLHDIGMSQIPYETASTSWMEHTPESREEYVHHVDFSVSLIRHLDPRISERVLRLVQQHHEKFDGTGYPQKLKGFKFESVAQILGMADLLDTVASGHWDGSAHPLRETFEILERLEKLRTFPEFFNPEIFEAVLKWIHHPDFLDAKKAAEKMIKQETAKLVKGVETR